MRIKKIIIKNYRCFSNQEINFDNYTCLIGTNGAGKSSVLMALNVFFRNTEAPSDVINLQEEDFHGKNTAIPIEITCVFTDISEAAHDDFKAYVRQGELVITAKAEWDSQKLRAEVKQIGSRKVMQAFAKYFEADINKASANDLKEIYKKIREEYPELPKVSTKGDMFGALRAFEEQHPELCEVIDSPYQFYGWSKGSDRLEKYIQWVYLPAVKDASEEQDEQRNSALGQLLQRSVRKKVSFDEQITQLRTKTKTAYQAIIDSESKALSSVEKQIQNRLRQWAHPGANLKLNWNFDEQRAISIAEPFATARVGEGTFLGELVRSGHGMQRSFLVALLQVLTELETENAPKLLLGFEEPELYQHPPQARHLAALLEELSQGEAQIIVTTHSPYFVNSKGYENIRLVSPQSNRNGACVTQMTFQNLSDRIAAALNEQARHPNSTMAAVQQIMQPSQTEMFFCRVPVFVEGLEDIAVFTTMLRKLKLWGKFRRYGCHFVHCDGKTNLSRPLAIAIGMGIEPFTIFDGDCDRHKNDYERDNKCLLSLVGHDALPELKSNLFERNFVAWRTRIIDEIQNEIGEKTWQDAIVNVRTEFGFQKEVKPKNGILVAACMDYLLSSGTKISVIEQACEKLVSFAESLSNSTSQPD